MNAPKPFLIQALPVVAIREILFNMTPSEVFVMSMCSKKMKWILKMNLYKVEEVWIVFPRHYNSSRTTVSIKTGEQSLNVFHLNTNDCTIEWDKTFVGHVYKQEWDVHTRYEFAEDAVVFHATYRMCIRNQLKAIHVYACDLFGFKPNQLLLEAKYSLDDDNFKEGTVKKFLGRIIDDVFFRSQRNMIISIIERNHDTSWAVKYDHGLFQVPAVIVRASDSIIDRFMYFFNGKHGLFENERLHEFYVKAFLRRWGQKEMEHLELFIAYQGDEQRFDPTSVLKLLELTRFNSNVSWLEGLRMEIWNRERVYPYELNISEHHTFPPDTFDCENGIDVVRDSDGKRATIKISTQHFMFFVWK